MMLAVGGVVVGAESGDPVFRTVVRKGGDDGVHTYRIPGLAVTTRGTLLAVYDIRHKGSGDLPGDIDVGVSRSTDDGTTWAPMRRVMDFDAAEPGSRGNGVGDPAILVDTNTGAVLVAALWSKGNRGWNGSGPGLRPEETGQFLIARSTDDGLTWEKPLNITTQVKQPEWRLCFQGPGNGIQLGDGTLVFPAQFKGADNVPHSCFIASADGGRTWRMSPPAIPGKPPTSESAIAEAPDGSLLLSMRDESRPGRRVWSRWTRSAGQPAVEGRWSEPWHDLPDPTCMASLFRHPAGPLLFANPADPKRRAVLTVRSSTDGGRTWNAGRVLEPAGAMYSSLAVLRDGRVGILYESVPAKGLVFERFPLKWLMNE
ncbi:MAG: hypothetical protein RJA22_297 [Verrucomicrobiota bacterium]